MKDLPKGAFGEAVKKARKEKKLTLEKLAELLNVTSAHVKQIESERRYPSVPVLFGLADALDLSLDNIVAEAGNEDTYELRNRINLALSKCDEHELSVIYATIEAMLNKDKKY